MGYFTDVPFDRGWDVVWKAIEEMRELKELYIVLKRGPWSGPAIWEKEIFLPMQRIQGIQSYDVEVNWPAKLPPGAPFTLSVFDVKDTLMGGRIYRH